MSSLLQPESEFLLECCHAFLDAREAVTFPGKELDWKALFQMAQTHQVLPIVYQSLRAEKEALPKAFWKKLEGAYKGNLLLVRLLDQELCQILQALQAAGVDGLPFKGRAVAHRFYADPALRSAGDIDLFVRQQDLSLAREVLESLHYESVHPESFWEEVGRIASSYSLTFQRSQAPRWNLDLHWDIARRHFCLPFGFESVWSKREMLRIQERPIANLGLEDQFFYLSLHGAKHRWNRLQWLLDLGLLMRERSEIDWALLRERAAQGGVLRLLTLGLGLLQDFWRLPLPTEFEAVVRQDPELNGLLASMKSELFETEEKHHSRPQFTGYLRHLRLRERRRDQWAIVLRLLFQPGREDYRLFGKLPFGTWLVFFLRPFRLLWHHGVRPLQRLAQHFLAGTPALTRNESKSKPERKSLQ